MPHACTASSPRSNHRAPAWLVALSAAVLFMVVAQLGAQSVGTPGYVRDIGRGAQTWVLLSGTIGGVSGMRQLETRLIASGFRVVTIDVYELSVDSTDVSFAAMARRVDATLKRLHVEGANVVGHAHGGGVALRLAASFPKRVAALHLLDVGALSTNRTVSMRSAISLVPIISRMPGGKTFIRTKLVAGIRENSGNTRWFDDAAERAYTQSMLDNVQRAVAMVQRLGDAQESESISELVARVHVPVTVILGQSPHSAAPGADQITALAPLGTRLRVVKLRGVGHFPHEEAPDQVMRTLLLTVSIDSVRKHNNSQHELSAMVPQ